SRYLPHLARFPTRRSSDLNLRRHFSDFSFRPALAFLLDVSLSRNLSGLAAIPEPSHLGFLGDHHAFYRHDDALVHGADPGPCDRSEEHTSELQSRENLVCR